MKQRIALLGVLALFVMLVCSVLPASADSWLTDRDTVEVDSGTVDFTYAVTDDGETTYDITVELPCPYNELSGMSDPVITINSTDAGGLTYSIDVNSESIVNNGVIAGVGSHTKTYSDIADEITNTTNVLEFEITCNNTDNEVYLYFTGTELALSSSWVDDAVEIEEKDVGTPEIEGVWSVNDSVNVDNDLGYTLTNLFIELVYPGHAQQEPVLNYTIASLADSANQTTYTQYQKAGPYFDVDDDIEDTTITIHAYEELEGVIWEFEPGDYDAFSTLESDDDLKIELDGNELEEGVDDDDPEDWYWNDDGDKIIFVDLHIYEDEDENDFEFIWSAEGAPSGGTDDEVIDDSEVPTEVPIYQQTYMGVPILLIVGVIALIVIVVIIAGKK